MGIACCKNNSAIKIYDKHNNIAQQQQAYRAQQGTYSKVKIESLTFDLTRGEFQKNSFINDPENQSIMVGGPNQTGGGSLHHQNNRALHQENENPLDIQKIKHFNTTRHLCENSNKIRNNNGQYGNNFANVRAIQEEQFNQSKETKLEKNKNQKIIPHQLQKRTSDFIRAGTIGVNKFKKAIDVNRAQPQQNDDMSYYNSSMSQFVPGSLYDKQSMADGSQTMQDGPGGNRIINLEKSNTQISTKQRNYNHSPDQCSSSESNPTSGDLDLIVSGNKPVFFHQRTDIFRNRVNSALSVMNEVSNGGGSENVFHQMSISQNSSSVKGINTFKHTTIKKAYSKKNSNDQQSRDINQSDKNSNLNVRQGQNHLSTMRSIGDQTSYFPANFGLQQEEYKRKKTKKFSEAFQFGLCNQNFEGSLYNYTVGGKGTFENSEKGPSLRKHDTITHKHPEQQPIYVKQGSNVTFLKAQHSIKTGSSRKENYDEITSFQKKFHETPDGVGSPYFQKKPTKLQISQKTSLFANSKNEYKKQQTSKFDSSFPETSVKDSSFCTNTSLEEADYDEEIISKEKIKSNQQKKHPSQQLTVNVNINKKATKGRHSNKIKQEPIPQTPQTFQDWAKDVNTKSPQLGLSPIKSQNETISSEFQSKPAVFKPSIIIVPPNQEQKSSESEDRQTIKEYEENIPLVEQQKIKTPQNLIRNPTDLDPTVQKINKTKVNESDLNGLMFQEEQNVTKSPLKKRKLTNPSPKDSESNYTALYKGKPQVMRTPKHGIPSQQSNVQVLIDDIIETEKLLNQSPYLLNKKYSIKRSCTEDIQQIVKQTNQIFRDEKLNNIRVLEEICKLVSKPLAKVNSNSQSSKIFNNQSSIEPGSIASGSIKQISNFSSTFKVISQKNKLQKINLISQNNDYKETEDIKERRKEFTSDASGSSKLQTPKTNEEIKLQIVTTPDTHNPYQEKTMQYQVSLKEKIDQHQYSIINLSPENKTQNQCITNKATNNFLVFRGRNKSQVCNKQDVKVNVVLCNANKHIQFNQTDKIDKVADKKDLSGILSNIIGSKSNQNQQFDNSLVSQTVPVSRESSLIKINQNQSLLIPENTIGDSHVYKYSHNSPQMSGRNLISAIKKVAKNNFQEISSIPNLLQEVRINQLKFQLQNQLKASNNLIAEQENNIILPINIEKRRNSVILQKKTPFSKDSSSRLTNYKNNSLIENSKKRSNKDVQGSNLYRDADERGSNYSSNTPGNKNYPFYIKPDYEKMIKSQSSDRTPDDTSVMDQTVLNQADYIFEIHQLGEVGYETSLISKDESFTKTPDQEPRSTKVMKETLKQNPARPKFNGVIIQQENQDSQLLPHKQEEHRDDITKLKIDSNSKNTLVMHQDTNFSQISSNYKDKDLNNDDFSRAQTYAMNQISHKQNTIKEELQLKHLMTSPKLLEVKQINKANLMSLPIQQLQQSMSPISRRDSALRSNRSITTISAVSQKINGKKIINQYIIIKKIGQQVYYTFNIFRGKFAKVQQVMDQNTKNMYAMKVLNKTKLKKIFLGKNKFAYQAVETEIAVLKLLEHDNIVRLYEIIDDPKHDKLYLIQEYINNGTLQERIVKKDPKIKDLLTEERCRKYFRQLISAVEYCHECAQIIHRDIKPENILIDSNDNVKLSDFGVSFMMENGSDQIETSAGSYYYFSPEACLGATYKGRKSDIWACGVTLYFMTYKCYPFESKLIPELFSKIQNEEPSYRPLKNQQMTFEITGEMKDLLKRILTKNPEKRLSIQQIKEHSWITQNGSNPMPKLEICELEPTEGEIQNFIKEITYEGMAVLRKLSQMADEKSPSNVPKKKKPSQNNFLTIMKTAITKSVKED